MLSAYSPQLWWYVWILHIVGGMGWYVCIPRVVVMVCVYSSHRFVGMSWYVCIPHVGVVVLAVFLCPELFSLVFLLSFGNLINNCVLDT